jgi:hypothetical protein
MPRGNHKNSSADVQAKLGGASEMLESAFQTGLGNSMQRIRIDKALFMLHELEGQITSKKDLYHVHFREAEIGASEDFLAWACSRVVTISL